MIPVAYAAKFAALGMTVEDDIWIDGDYEGKLCHIVLFHVS
jgi:uncharacterized protein YuzE